MQVELNTSGIVINPQTSQQVVLFLPEKKPGAQMEQLFGSKVELLNSRYCEQLLTWPFEQVRLVVLVVVLKVLFETKEPRLHCTQTEVF